jgi:hypothetical protein
MEAWAGMTAPAAWAGTVACCSGTAALAVQAVSVERVAMAGPAAMVDRPDSLVATAVQVAKEAWVGTVAMPAFWAAQAGQEVTGVQADSRAGMGATAAC